MKQRKKVSAPAPRSARGAAKRTSRSAADSRRPVSHSRPAATTLELAGEYTVAEASSLKKRLAGFLDQPLPVTLDVNSLQRIDTAGLQLITAFVRERAARGRSVEWHGSAPALTTAAQLLGLAAFLNLP